jgi:hypothetical protein
VGNLLVRDECTLTHIYTEHQLSMATDKLATHVCACTMPPPPTHTHMTLAWQCGVWGNTWLNGKHLSCTPQKSERVCDHTHVACFPRPPLLHPRIAQPQGTHGTHGGLALGLGFRTPCTPRGGVGSHPCTWLLDLSFCMVTTCGCVVVMHESA